MAEAEGDDWVEGYNAVGKPLDRLTTHKQLHDLLRDVTENKGELDNQVAKEQEQVQKLITSLSKINDDYLKETRGINAMKEKQTVSLTGEKRKEVKQTMADTLSTFLEKRPTDLQEEGRSVHVYFLAGEECGSELHIGREGAGSRDATFIVKLSQTVQSLATQAAKYWGLDPLKVFFLDHHGRIVPGKMTLNHIILPPVPQDDKSAANDMSEGAVGPLHTMSVTAGGSASQAAAQGAISTDIALADGDHEDQTRYWTVRGQDYSLTLVRAKTVLDKEDLSMPRGEKWDDFTFDADALNKDLEQTRKKRGDPEINNQVIGLDAIPSLYDLIAEGAKRKRKKKADMLCRIVEFAFFLIMFGFFQYILAPESSWTYTMYLIGQNVRTNITTFNLLEQELYGIKSFNEINSRAQYIGWLDGPLTRSLFPDVSAGPGVGGGLQSMNIHPLVVQGRTYRNDHQKPLDLNWCTTAGDGTDANDTNGTDGTATESASSSSDDGTDGSNASNASNTTSADTCIPDIFKSCGSEDVIDVLRKGLSLNQTVPGCEPIYHQSGILTWLENFNSLDAFSYVNGEMYSYIGGRMVEFNLSDSTEWSSTLDQFKPSMTALSPPAKLLNVFVYQPSVEGVLLMQFLTEFSPSGPVVSTAFERSLSFQSVSDFEWVAYGVCIVLAVIVLIMEMQRLLRWPERFVFEEKAESAKCTCWTVIFYFLPGLLSLSLVLRAYRSSLTLDIPKLKSQAMVGPENSNMMNSMPEFLAKGTPFEWTESAMTMHDIQAMMEMGRYWVLLNLFNFACMVSLFFRYTLMYFPFFAYLTKMVRQVMKPLLVVLILLAICLTVYGTVFYVVLSDNIFVFRNSVSTMLSTIQYAHGGIIDWKKWYKEYSWTFIFIMWTGFFVFTLNLNHYAVAVLVSHKKEAELRRNYSSHPFWQLVHRKEYGRCKELNPSLIGWNFTGKEPKEVTENPGSK